VTRVIPFILYLFLIAADQVMLKEFTAVYSAQINVAALLVLAVAVYKQELVAARFGLAAGLVLAAGHPALMGWQALWLVGLGLLAFHTREQLNLESLYARLLLVLGGVIVHNLLVLVTTSGITEFWYSLITTVLPGAVYTTLVAWLFFLFKEGRITWAKVRALF